MNIFAYKKRVKKLYCVILKIDSIISFIQNIQNKYLKQEFLWNLFNVRPINKFFRVKL